MDKKLEVRSRVIEILSESFYENPSVHYVVKNDHKVNLRIKALMEYAYDMCFKFGKVILSDDKNSCALLMWSAKKKTVVPWDIKLALKAIGLARVPKVLKRESMIKKHHPETPFLYLWFIGVDPAHQKQGLGPALLNQVIDISRDENTPIYLETSVPENIPWYKKHGFEVYKSINLDHKLSMLRRTL